MPGGHATRYRLTRRAFRAGRKCLGAGRKHCSIRGRRQRPAVRFGETLFDKFDYTYYLDGSRESETRTNADGTTTVEWTYDGLNRLVSEEFSGFDGQGDPLAYTDTYSFDLSSNRTKLVHDDQTSGGGGSAGPDSTTTYVYDANDRLLTETKDVAGSSTADRHTVYGYSPTDQAAKTVHEGLSSAGTVVEDVDFIYDASGRMTAVTIVVGSGDSITYRYDHNGFRVESTLNGTTRTIFHVEPNNPTGHMQSVEEGADVDGDSHLDAGDIAKTFVLGLDITTQATPTQLLHLLYDGRNTTKAALNASSSSVIEHYAYSAYGSDLALAVSPQTDFRYAGQFIDTTGLSLNGARWYDSSIGQWKRMDPWTGNSFEPLSYHEYGYTHANPVNGHDPTGMFFQFIFVGRAAATISEFAVTRYFTPSWGFGRTIAEQIDWEGISDPFELAGLHQHVLASQIADIQSEARRGLAAVYASTAAMWDAWFAAWDDLAFNPLDLALGMIGGRACFIAGTQVLVGYDDGKAITKSIEDIEIGDRVLARDHMNDDDDLDGRPVVQVFRRISDHLRFVSYQDTEGSSETLTTTDEHPFWVEGLGWVAAAHLQPGMVLGDADGPGGPNLTVTKSIREDRPEGVTVFNFEVEGDHTYFVGSKHNSSTSAWVHNACGVPLPIAARRGHAYPQGVASYAGRKAWRVDVANARINTHGVPGKHLRATTDEQARLISDGGGQAQYLPRFVKGGRHGALERMALQKGVIRQHRPGTYHSYLQFDEVVGYSNGKPTTWIRAELTNNGKDIHGFPVAPDDVRLP